MIKSVLSIAALSLAMLAPVSFATPALAAPSATCFTKALNGDTIDPPICVVPEAHKGSAGEGGYVIPGKTCTKQDDSHCTY